MSKPEDHNINFQRQENSHKCCMSFWCRMLMKECLSLSSKQMDGKGKCRRVAVRADICLINLRMWRAVASCNLTRCSPVLTVIIVSRQSLNWMLKSSVMRHSHWSGSFWHFEGLWSNAENKAVDPSDSRIHSPNDTVSHSSSLESSALLLWEWQALQFL
jgi:hypothetical protein